MKKYLVLSALILFVSGCAEKTPQERCVNLLDEVKSTAPNILTLEDVVPTPIKFPKFYQKLEPMHPGTIVDSCYAVAYKTDNTKSNIVYVTATTSSGDVISINDISEEIVAHEKFVQKRTESEICSAYYDEIPAATASEMAKKIDSYISLEEAFGKNPLESTMKIAFPELSKNAIAKCFINYTDVFNDSHTIAYSVVNIDDFYGQVVYKDITEEAPLIMYNERARHMNDTRSPAVSEETDTETGDPGDDPPVAIE